MNLANLKTFHASFIVLTVFALSSVFSIQAWSDTAGGWQALLRNRNGEARTAFRSALQQNPSDPGALRGMAVLNAQEDRMVAELQAWRTYYHVASAGWQAAAWWPEVVDTAQRTGQWDLLEGAARDILATK